MDEQYRSTMKDRVSPGAAGRHGAHLRPVRFGLCGHLVQRCEHVRRQVFASQYRKHAICDARRKFVGPLVDGLIGDTDLLGG